MGEVNIGIPRKSRKQIADGLSRLHEKSAWMLRSLLD